MEQQVYRIWTYVHSFSVFTYVNFLSRVHAIYLSILPNCFIITLTKIKIKPSTHFSFQPSRVLTAFEESSTACISDMPRQVNNGAYLDILCMAEKFILHVEVLFGTIDDLEWVFSERGIEGMFPYAFNFV